MPLLLSNQHHRLSPLVRIGLPSPHVPSTQQLLPLPPLLLLLLLLSPLPPSLVHLHLIVFLRVPVKKDRIVGGSIRDHCLSLAETTPFLLPLTLLSFTPLLLFPPPPALLTPSGRLQSTPPTLRDFPCSTLPPPPAQPAVQVNAALHLNPHVSSTKEEESQCQ